MRIERHKNFLTKEECATLNAWVREGVSKNWLDRSNLNAFDCFTKVRNYSVFTNLIL